MVSVGAGSRERNDLILLGGFGGHELDHRLVDVELPERNRRHAVLSAQESGDLVVFDEAELDQIEAELPPVRALVVQRLLKLLGRDALLFEKQFSDSNRHEENPVYLSQPSERCPGRNAPAALVVRPAEHHMPVHEHSCAHGHARARSVGLLLETGRIESGPSSNLRAAGRIPILRRQQRPRADRRWVSSRRQDQHPRRSIRARLLTCDTSKATPSLA